MPSGARDNAREFRYVFAKCHAVNQSRGSTFGFKFSLENEGAVAIPPTNLPDRISRRDRPMPVAIGSEQSSKTGRGIEVRKAEPVNRSLLRDQRRRVAVADHGVIFDRKRQYFPSAKQ